ncbi:MAG: UDP-glucose/GDP-mannose dehydrogenase family protein, partial [Candidatus Diapherotrites archaeon]|nr:UDP-glucose/GDP-mannose dehydrogenase family protein [Candidatus Diapherotrites archaeon]
MKICVVGTGYVGLVAGTCLAELGNEVKCVDIDQNKISNLNSGILPIYEPGLEELVLRNVKEKRLAFSTDVNSVMSWSEVIFIAVGTPEGKEGKADLSAVFSVAKSIGKNLNNYKVIVDKSTVPVGTADKVAELIRQNSSGKIVEFDVVSNPEFLREGEAVNDFLFPNRVVIGANSEKAKHVMREIYRGIERIDRPMMFTDIKSAEMIKYASNAMLATRISFMNEVAMLCEKLGADVKDVAKGMGLDERIGPRFLQAGAGYGGSCFPKDVQAFIHTAKENNSEFKILEAVEEVNDLQKKSIVPKLKKLLPELKGKKIALWGLAFKPKTDDMREAPAITIIEQLFAEGVKIHAFDPVAGENARKLFPKLELFPEPLEALKGCSGLIIVTEWNEFRNLDKKQIKELLLEPNIVDAR